jgi:hypothetical protein
LLHVRFLAFQVGTSHSIRSSFTGLDQREQAFDSISRAGQKVEYSR